MSRSLSASSGRDKKHFSLHGTSSLGAASIHWARRKVSATWRRNVNSGQALLLQVKCKTGGRQQVKREPRAGCDKHPSSGKPSATFSRHYWVNAQISTGQSRAALLTFTSWLIAPLILSSPSRCWRLDSQLSCSWLSPLRTSSRHRGSW